MPFLKEGKTNWKYILIVVILAFVVSGGILVYWRQTQEELSSVSKFPEIKVQKKIKPENTFLLEDLKEGRNEVGGIMIEKIVPSVVKGIIKEEKENFKYYEFSIENLATVGLRIFDKYDPDFDPRAKEIVWYWQNKEVRKDDNSLMLEGIDEPYISHFKFGGDEYVIFPDYSFGANQQFYFLNFYIIDQNNLMPVKDQEQKGFLVLNSIYPDHWYSKPLSILGYEDSIYLLNFPSWFSSGSCSSGCTEVDILKKDRIIDHLSLCSGNSGDERHPYIDSIIIREQSLYLQSGNNYCFDIGTRGLLIDEACDVMLSACVDGYYRLGEEEIIQANEEFKEDFLENVKKYDFLLSNEENWKEFPREHPRGLVPLEIFSPELKIYGRKNWLVPLISRTLNYIFAGERDIAWQTFEQDFDLLSLEYPLPEYKGRPFLEAEFIEGQIERELRERESKGESN